MGRRASVAEAELLPPDWPGRLAEPARAPKLVMQVTSFPAWRSLSCEQPKKRVTANLRDRSDVAMSRHRIKARRATSPAIVAAVIVGLVATAFAAVEVSTPSSDPVPEPVAMEIPQMPAQEKPEQETVSLPEPEAPASDSEVGRAGLPELFSAPAAETDPVEVDCSPDDAQGPIAGLDVGGESCVASPATAQGEDVLDQPMFRLAE